MLVKAIVATAIVGVCTLLVVVGLRTARAPQQTKAVHQIKNDPLTIAVSAFGASATGTHSWYLSVNSAGKAELAVETFPQRTRREFTVPQEELLELRKLLLSERFFELEAVYGQSVPDDTTQTITVTAGDESKTVRIHYLMNWIKDDKHKLRDPARALRVLLLIRDWFDDPAAVDLRQYDRMVIEAADAAARSDTNKGR